MLSYDLFCHVQSMCVSVHR